jgi:monothiol glutaredoxin
MDTQEIIQQQISQNEVVLYMKGSPDFPQCGFSANAVRILKASGVENIFSVDVLQDPAIRQGIKEFSEWPTVPQLYIRGEFIGGSDIMTEMYQSGELADLLKNKV